MGVLWGEGEGEGEGEREGEREREGEATRMGPDDSGAMLKKALTVI